MSDRPAVSVIVPYTGPQFELERVLDQLRALRLEHADEVIVADNRPGAQSRGGLGQVRTVAAAGIRSAAFARNRGVAAAANQWLVFIDADTSPSPTLLDDYFTLAPDPRTAILAGGIIDVAGGSTRSARYGVARRQMSHDVTLLRAGAPYAQTANCAVRRIAFDAVGGFAERARAGEDADLCFRLRDAGWGLEERTRASVEHRSRPRLSASLRQLMAHGSGAGWCDRRHPGSFPRPSARELAGRLRAGARTGLLAARRGDREGASFALLDLAGVAAFELGRLIPNRARRG
jgi:mycofactocin glycosyltransferase